MALFRFHRGSLEQSIKTTVIVKNLNDVIKLVVDSASEFLNEENQHWVAKFQVIPYPDEENNFDPRIGWYTHMVLSNIYEKEKFHPVGLLSESLF